MTYSSLKSEKKHKHLWSAETGDPEIRCRCGAVKSKNIDRALPKTNKYRAKKSNYNGYVYDSMKEANHAAELDMRLKAKDILGWEKQYPVHVYAEGHHLFTTKVDFRVKNLDGSYTLQEIKGWITARRPDYRLKRKCLELLWLPKNLDHTYEEIQ